MMKKVIYLAILAVFILQAALAASLDAQQDKAVKAYLSKANKEAATNNVVVELENSFVADLNGDGKNEIILHTVDYGPTFSSSNLAVLGVQGKNYRVIVAEGLLGNVSSVEVKNGLIYVHAMLLGPNDPICCPTRKDTTIFVLQENKLVVKSDKTSGIPRASVQQQAAVHNTEWKFVTIKGLKLAGISNAVTGIRSLNVFCEGKIPALAVSFSASQPNPVRLEIQIGQVIYPFIFAQQSSSGYRSVNLTKSAFPKGLISGQQQARVNINGMNHGMMSLRNAGSTSRAALSGCYRY